MRGCPFHKVDSRRIEAADERKASDLGISSTTGQVQTRDYTSQFYQRAYRSPLKPDSPYQILIPQIGSRINTGETSAR